ncbi:MAG: hypothetical protein OXT71_10200 [Acidobacteriota bacterium]|nr:hypothetical protein [Acidobacteriota bacterium]
MTENILALDFDGVICDSARECLFTSYSCYGPVAGFPPASNLEEISPSVRGPFFRMRPFVRDGKDYIVILNLILGQDSVSRQQDFDRRARELLPDLCASMGVSDPRALEEVFQEHRRTLRQRDEAAWMEMNPLYAGVEEGLRSCRRHFGRIYVTTSKPSDAAAKILQYQKIDLATDHVYGYDRVRRARGKNGHLAHLHELTGAPYSRIHFVDDQVSHLQSASELGVGCYHATWGYTTPEQVKDGISASVTPLQEESAAAWMRRLLS